MRRATVKRAYLPVLLSSLVLFVVFVFHSFSRTYLFSCNNKAFTQQKQQYQLIQPQQHNSENLLQDQENQLKRQQFQLFSQQQQQLDADSQSIQNSDPNCNNVFLFIGILSAGNFYERREAVRKSWLNDVNQRPDTCGRFVVSQIEQRSMGQQELQDHSDFLVMEGNQSSYDQILSKVLHVFAYGVNQANAKFILKTDDDAYVNVPVLIDRLKLICQEKDCNKVYMGNEARNVSVNLQKDHKWYDGWFFNQTGLTTYPRYMWGGGYVMSRSIAEEIVFSNDRGSLFKTPIEDASVGMWLAPKNVDYYHVPEFVTGGFECCLSGKTCTRNIHGVPANFASWKQLAKSLKRGVASLICQPDPLHAYIILHKISIPCKLELVGDLFRGCQHVHSAAEKCIKDGYVIGNCKPDLFDLPLFDPRIAHFYSNVYNDRKNMKWRRKYSDTFSTWRGPFAIDLMFELYQNITGYNMSEYYSREFKNAKMSIDDG